MQASAMIDAIFEGVSFEQLYRAVKAGRVTVSRLSEEEQAFYDNMSKLVTDGVKALSSAIASDDKKGLRETCGSLRELLQMIEDASNETGDSGGSRS